MRIAIVTDVVYPFMKGGAEKKYYEIAKRLAAKGHEIVFFSQKWWDGSEDFTMEKGIKIHAVSPMRPLFNSKGRRSILTSLSFTLGLLKNGPLSKGQKFDIIDCNEYPMVHTIPFLLHAKLRGARTVLMVHEVWGKWWFKYAGIFAPIAIVIEKINKKIPNGVFVNSEYLKKRVEKLCKNKSSIFTLHAGVDTSFYEKIEKSEKEFDCIFLGRLIYQKHVENFVNAIFFVKKKYNKVTACIIGEGPKEKNLKALAKKLNLEDNITFEGKIDDEKVVASFLKSSKVFFYPTSPEGGWSLSILEGYSSGLPCVTIRSSPLGSGEEIVLDGKTGLLVNDCSPEKIAEKLLDILTNEELRMEMVENSLAFAKKYDWDVIATKAEKYYMKISSG